MRSPWRRDRMTLAEQLELEDVLFDAFAPLRIRATTVSAARVRAIVHWGRKDAAPRGALALFPRLAESSLAAAVAAFLFAGTLAGIERPAAERTVAPGDEPVVHVSRPLDDGTFFRWVRIGRSAAIADSLDPTAAARATRLEDAVAPVGDAQGRTP